MKRRTRQATHKLIALVLIPIISLSLVGIAHSLWSESLYIEGTVNTGYWKACVKIRKILDGAFTDPYSETGADLTIPTNLIAISADFPTKFKLIIEVENCGSTTLTDVVVTDTIKANVAPMNWIASVGYVSWTEEQLSSGFIFNYLEWDIGTLAPGESVSLVIWIETLKNPSDNSVKYAPTSGDEGDSQDLEINEGATVTAETELASLSAKTGGITIQIVDDSTQGNNIGLIATDLPYDTDWAEDEYP